MAETLVLEGYFEGFTEEMLVSSGKISPSSAQRILRKYEEKMNSNRN